jgi:hypothetical protein
MMTKRMIVVTAAAVMAACGGGSENDGHLIDAMVPGDPCEEMLEAGPSTRAGMYVFDVLRVRDAPRITHRVNECELDGAPLTRGGLLAQGFEQGARTYSVETDGVVVTAPEVETVVGDQVYYVLDAEQPPNIVGGAKGRSIPPVDGWAVMVMNVSATPITISRVVDPEAVPRQYEVLASDVGYGESMLPRVLAANPESGAWVRVERGGEVIFEDNPLFFRMCETWPVGGNAVFMLFEDVAFPYSQGVMYGSLEQGCPGDAAGVDAGAAAGIGTIVRLP